MKYGVKLRNTRGTGAVLEIDIVVFQCGRALAGAAARGN